MKNSLILLFALTMLVLLLSGCATGLLPGSWPGITVDGQSAYVAAGPHVYAVDLQTGNELWRYPAKASASKSFYAAPVLASEDQLILGGFDHILYSINPQTQNENWKFDKARDRWIGAPLAANDTIYAPNADYRLYALTLDGKLKWSFLADQSIWGTPVTDGVNVYFGTLGRNVYAVDAQSGEKVWQQTLRGAVLGSPVLGDEEMLFVAEFDGSLAILNKTDGSILWQEVIGSRLWATPAREGNILYIGDDQGNFYAFDLLSRTAKILAQRDSPILGTPLLLQNKIAFGTENESLYLISADGTPLWQQTLSGKLYGNPVAAGDLILVAPLEGDSVLVALDLNGAQKWVFKPSNKK